MNLLPSLIFLDQRSFIYLQHAHQISHSIHGKEKIYSMLLHYCHNWKISTPWCSPNLVYLRGKNWSKVCYGGNDSFKNVETTRDGVHISHANLSDLVDHTFIGSGNWLYLFKWILVILPYDQVRYPLLLNSDIDSLSVFNILLRR